MTTIAFRDSAQNHFTTVGATKSVVIPSLVQTGDLLLLFYSGRAAPDSVPSGWTQVAADTDSDGPNSGYCYQRVAQSGDGGTTVTVAASTSAKTALGIVAYSGTSTTGPIALSAHGVESGTSATHASQSLVTTTTGWIVKALMMKDGGTLSSTWAGPTSVTTNRVQEVTAGANQTVLVINDSNGDLTAGTYAGNWTADQSTNSAVMIAVQIAPTSTTTVVRPIADITTTGFTTVPSGQTLFSVTADDDSGTWAESPVGGGSCEVKLGALSAAPNVISVKGFAAGGAAGQSITTYLVEGTTVRGTYGPETSLVTTETEYRYTLSAPEKASITDNTNLRVRQTSVMS